MSDETSDDVLRELHEYEREINPKIKSRAERYLREKKIMQHTYKKYIEKRNKLSDKFIEKCIKEGDKYWYGVYAAKDIDKSGEPRQHAEHCSIYSTKERAEYAIKVISTYRYSDDILPKNPVVVKIPATDKVDTEFFNWDFSDEADEDVEHFCEYVVEHDPFSATNV